MNSNLLLVVQFLLMKCKELSSVSLLVLAAVAYVFSMLFRMSDVISGILAMRIMVQFIGQAVGVVLLRKRNGSAHLQYKMPLYPLPVILAIAMWLFVFYSTGFAVIKSFLIVFGTGVVVYFIYAKLQLQWPYRNKKDETFYEAEEIIGDNNN